MVLNPETVKILKIIAFSAKSDMILAMLLIIKDLQSRSSHDTVEKKLKQGQCGQLFDYLCDRLQEDKKL
jgi:hypothetical protein